MKRCSPELNYTKFRGSLNNKFALILQFSITHFFYFSPALVVEPNSAE